MQYRLFIHTEKIEIITHAKDVKHALQIFRKVLEKSGTSQLYSDEKLLKYITKL